MYDDVDPDPQIAQVIQSSLDEGRDHRDLKQVPQYDLYGNYIVTPSQAKSGAWDLAIVDWGPDWFGNNGRTTIQPLLDGSTYGPGSSDYGDYTSTAETKLINKALAASSARRPIAAWAAADRQAMRDAAIVPIDVHKHAVYHSSKVKNWHIDPYSRVGDVTNVWLSASGGSPRPGLAPGPGLVLSQHKPRTVTATARVLAQSAARAGRARA